MNAVGTRNIAIVACAILMFEVYLYTYPVSSTINIAIVHVVHRRN